MTTSTPTPEAAAPDARAKSAARLVMALTIARFAAAPIVAGLILWGHNAAFTQGPAAMGTLYALALLIFGLAALTDWADGAIARRMGVTSTLGAALDHAADKVLTSVTLIALVYALLPLPLVIAALILIGRDFAIAGLREGLAGAGPAVAFAGKLKSAAAMIGVASILAEAAAGAFGWPLAAIRIFDWAGHAGLWAAAALALFSAALYVRAAVSPA
jgi:CDP-diacylglycerol--glycerol-3-phosphate 3-phosphatidyltransferase